MYSLENKDLRLECTEKGAQMTSLKDRKTGRELLYQGDQAWKDQDPTLFPVIGSTWSGTYEIDGRTYAMKNHGLIRYAILEGSQQQEVLAFRLDSSDWSRQQYPFDFSFLIEYRLDGRKVKIDYTITNTGDRPMPFTLGLHPAFATDPFEDCVLKFWPEGEAIQFHTHEDGSPIDYEKVTLKDLPLDREEIRKERTLIWKDFAATQATLEQSGKDLLTVEFPGFPYLAVWTHPQDSEFVCIEPWYGHADLEKTDVPFEEREGTMILEPGKTWNTGYVIDVKE